MVAGSLTLICRYLGTSRAFGTERWRSYLCPWVANPDAGTGKGAFPIRRPLFSWTFPVRSFNFVAPTLRSELATLNGALAWRADLKGQRYAPSLSGRVIEFSATCCQQAATTRPGTTHHSSLPVRGCQETRSPSQHTDFLSPRALNYRCDFVSLDSTARRCHNGGPQKYCREQGHDLQLS